MSMFDEDDDDLHERGERMSTVADGTLVKPVPDGPEVTPPDADPIGDAWHTLGELEGEDDWFDKAPPPRAWLLELPGLNGEAEPSTGMVPLGTVGMLAAAGGAGKTMALIQLALAVATGRKWLDTYTTPSPGHVLLALGEERLPEVRRRVHSAARIMQLTPGQKQDARGRIVILALAGKRVSFIDAASKRSAVLESLTKRLKSSAHEWRLIVLDPLSRFAGGETEKDNAEATAYIEEVETLTEVQGNPTVLLAPHTNKSARADDGNAREANAVRGASALTDGARWVAHLDPHRGDSDCVELAFSKHNYSPKTRSITLVRDVGGALRPERPDERVARIKDAEDAADAAAAAKVAKAEQRKQQQAAANAATTKVQTQQTANVAAAPQVQTQQTMRVVPTQRNLLDR